MAKKKEAILKAAAVLFAEKGYTESSIAELARMTNSAEGTIFYHFKTKADLFIAVLADIQEGIISEFNTYMSSCKFENGI